MYPVTTEFQNKIKETTRTFKLLVQIQHSTGTLELSDKDIVGGSIIFAESTQTGDNFTIGGTVASTFEFELFRKPEHDLITFEGATVIPQVGLMLSEESSEVLSEVYFLNTSQPLEFETESYEYAPLGRFNIDEPVKSRNTIRLKAIDNMVEFDKPYSLSQLSYPANLYQIYLNACSVCDVQPGTVNFPNKDYVVQNRPEGDYTFRDIIGYVAELAGCFAKINRYGALEIKWYTSTGLTLSPANRFDFKPREDLVQIKGIMSTVTDENGEEVTYLTGTDDYAVDLSDNPLLQGSYETVLPNIFDNVKDTIFTPYESRWQGNPALEAGDALTQIDRDGNILNTIVTYSSYKYRGASTLSAKGLPLRAKGYKGSTNKKIASIIRKVEKEIGDKLTSLEQAQLNVTELIANMLGGYVVKTDEALYIADNPDINLTQKVWKWGIGGFGYSSTGVSGPYTTGISADGTIVAMIIAANIITADMVKTGILSSEDDSTWINLDDGTFNFKNLLSYDGTVFTLNDPTVIKSTVSYKGATIDTVSGIRVNFANGGHAQMGDGSILVQHADGSHTVIDGRGIMRLFSIPIFEDVPTGTDIIDDFETGLLADTRVDLTKSEAENNQVRSAADYITITSAQKYAGTYGLQVRTPAVGLILTNYNPDTHLYTGYYYTYINCVFLNYMPTKDTTFSLKYKVSGVPTRFLGKLIIEDVDYPSEPIQEFTLSSTAWTSISAFLTGHHTYRIRVVMSASDNFDTNKTINIDDIMYAYFDDIVYELDVNESIIVGYEEGTKAYNDFTYIRKDEVLTGTTQKQIVLPDYFRGLNFDVLVTQLENYATPTLLSINNKLPSFTVSGENTKFMYTVILNS
jgi:hypothetical protein